MDYNKDIENYLVDLSRKTESYIKKIDSTIGKLSTTDYNALSEVNDMVGPKKRLDELILFYDQYILLFEYFENVKEDVESIENPTIEVYNEREILRKIDNLRKPMESLEKYKQVTIVNDIFIDLNMFLKATVENIQGLFLDRLKILPAFPHGISGYSSFICRHLNKKNFLILYTNRLFKYLKFPIQIYSLSSIYQYISKINQYLDDILKTNRAILEDIMIPEFNNLLANEIVGNIYNITCTSLNSFQDDLDGPYAIESIYDLVSIYRAINEVDSSKSPALKMVYKIKPKIAEILHNCLLQWEHGIVLIKKPNKKCVVEPWLSSLVTSISSITSSSELLDTMEEKYGSKYPYKNAKALKNSFIEMGYRKTSELSKLIKENIRNAVYHIVNTYPVERDYTGKNFNFEEILKRYTDNIVNELKARIAENSTNKEFNKTLIMIVDESKQYKLPPEIAQKIQKKISKHIENIIGEKNFMYIGKTVNEDIHNIYM